MSTWEYPPVDLTLPDGEIHIWRAALQLPAARLEPLARLLSADERERAERFKFPEHRDRFIVSRGALRQLLGRYLDAAPQSLDFAYGDHGKPFLCGAEHLHFNLSHSRDLALYAVAQRRQLGIDVEYARRPVNDAEIAERFFAKEEVAAFREVPKARQAEAFYNCWTRKEAYLKARGEGITVSLDSFVVSLKPGEKATLLHCHRFPWEVSRWSLHTLTPQPDYIAALCVENGHGPLRCWQWSDGS